MSFDPPAQPGITIEQFRNRSARKVTPYDGEAVDSPHARTRGPNRCSA
jgi:hypothetical protein